MRFISLAPPPRMFASRGHALIRGGRRKDNDDEGAVRGMAAAGRGVKGVWRVV